MLIIRNEKLMMKEGSENLTRLGYSEGKWDRGMLYLVSLWKCLLEQVLRERANSRNLLSATKNRKM